MFARAWPTLYAVLACVLPALVLFTLPEHSFALTVAGMLAAAVAIAFITLSTSSRLRLPLGTAGPASAQRRLRGSFLRQSNPDTAGRVRPRAPGGAVG
ncbi:hypothetical protein D5S18_32565 [Nocardia panacis]|uniref:Uncharacterized protein n=1 Tax=Nocardia panacis TaxID=2340916 RepID=A0A3A4K8E2_9NOCA|nr:DUF6412 domain-containing protein [Nocardia panacis]RJO68178.1 hypothetical protein D5S18_32565 [Nocardia panacis]